jgi:transcriptional regulator with XRE-family HTH domain
VHGERTKLQEPPTIGQRIRAVRQQAGLSLDRLAEALGCSRRALINWEQNAAEPPIGLLPKLRDLYDVDPEWIIRGKDLVPRSRFRLTDWARFDRIADDVAAACTQVGIGYDDKVITELVRDLFDDEPADYDANSKQLRRTLLAIARGKA